MGNAAAVQSSTDAPGHQAASETGTGGEDAVFSRIPESQQESKAAASTRGAKSSSSTTSMEGVPDTGFSDSDDEEASAGKPAAAKPSMSPVVAKRHETERSTTQVANGTAAGSPAQRTLIVGGGVLGSHTYEQAFEDEISRDVALERSALEKSTLRSKGSSQQSSDAADAPLEGSKKHKKKKKKKHSKQDRERRAREEKGDEEEEGGGGDDDDFDFDENDIDPELARKQMVELANEATVSTAVVRTDSAITAEAMRRADEALREKQQQQQQQQQQRLNKGDVDEPIEIDGVVYNRPSGGGAAGGTGAPDTWSANDDEANAEVWTAESESGPDVWQADANVDVWRPDDGDHDGGGSGGPDVWRPDDDSTSGADVWRSEDGSAAEPDRLVLN